MSSSHDTSQYRGIAIHRGEVGDTDIVNSGNWYHDTYWGIAGIAQYYRWLWPAVPYVSADTSDDTAGGADDTQTQRRRSPPSHHLAGRLAVNLRRDEMANKHCFRTIRFGSVFCQISNNAGRGCIFRSSSESVLLPSKHVDRCDTYGTTSTVLNISIWKSKVDVKRRNSACVNALLNE